MVLKTLSSEAIFVSIAPPHSAKETFRYVRVLF